MYIGKIVDTSKSRHIFQCIQPNDKLAVNISNTSAY